MMIIKQLQKSTANLYFSTIFVILLFISPSQTEEQFTQLRKNMVAHQLERRDIKDQKVLEVMRKVKRHLFVDEKFKREAYNDHPLPIGEGQTISQPYIVAMMTQILDVKPGEKILEIGTGSGYQTAVLAELTDSVFSIEVKEKLAAKVKIRLKNLGYHNVKTKYGDGYYGWEEHAPFDAVIITAAANHIPPPLIKQIKEGGKLLLPLGSTRYWQNLTLATKRNGELTDIKHLMDVVFVPMTGKVLNK